MQAQHWGTGGCYCLLWRRGERSISSPGWKYVIRDNPFAVFTAGVFIKHSGAFTVDIVSTALVAMTGSELAGEVDSVYGEFSVDRSCRSITVAYEPVVTDTICVGFERSYGSI